MGARLLGRLQVQEGRWGAGSAGAICRPTLYTFAELPYTPTTKNSYHVQFAELPYTLLPTYPTPGRKFRFFQVEFAGLPYTPTLSGPHCR